MLCWLLITTGANLQPLLMAGPLLTAGITTVGTNVYPYTNKPVAGSQINWSRSLSSNLVSAVPLNEGSGTSFYDAVSQQSYSAKILSGTPTGATPPTWFTPTLSSTYPWAGAAISNNGATAQAIQSPFSGTGLNHQCDSRLLVCHSGSTARYQYVWSHHGRDRGGGNYLVSEYPR